MAARPAKRQRRLTVLSDDDEAPAQDRTDAPQLPSRTKTRVPLSRTASWSSSTSPGKKGKDKTASQDGSGTTKSLHSFFQAATEEQRWSAVRKSEKANVRDGDESEEFDLIEDDSYDEIFESLSNSQGTRVKSTPQTRSTQRSKPSRRFILPESPKSRSRRQKLEEEAEKTGSQPWAEKFAPADLSELAVHKKKVADVRNWLTDALSGRSRRVCNSRDSSTALYFKLTASVETTGSVRSCRQRQNDDSVAACPVYGLRDRGVEESNGGGASRAGVLVLHCAV